MNILLIGSGGREHALAWKLAQSRLLQNGDRLFAAPGNPGMAECAALVTLDVADHAQVMRFCEEREIGLVVVGPEAPLVAGLADAQVKEGQIVKQGDALGRAPRRALQGNPRILYELRRSGRPVHPLLAG